MTFEVKKPEFVPVYGNVTWKIKQPPKAEFSNFSTKPNLTAKIDSINGFGMIEIIFNSAVDGVDIS